MDLCATDKLSRLREVEALTSDGYNNLLAHDARLKDGITVLRARVQTDSTEHVSH